MFSKPEDVVCNFMIEKSNYCSDVMKNYFNKELIMTKKMMEILRTLLNVEFVIMFMLK